MANNFIELQKEIINGVTDLLTLQRQNSSTFPFLLQSAVKENEPHPHARYDILFACPGDQLILKNSGQLFFNDTEFENNDFLDALDRIWKEQMPQPENRLELPFTGGWFVFLGYELAAQIETRLVLPMPEDDMPVAMATRIPAAIINDHQHNRTVLVAETEQLLDRLKHFLTGQAEAPVTHSVLLADLNTHLEEDPANDYLQQVEKVKQYIIDGDVFQVNLSRAWQGTTPVTLSAADIYHNLRQSNPAPFAALACYEWGAIISSSPERLVRVRNGIAETRPIAGTRPRSHQSDDDIALKSELIAHPKERAEHVMLIDLERNDLGRICQPGSIEVDEFMVLESYAHVHHIVSNIKGELRPDVSPGQVIRAVFPGGTITGCPKERCMAIIAELEQTARGAYTGSVGYINHNGDMDLNILIRTISMDRKHLRIRAGAGLVADSIAERELEETRHKARGMLLALGAVQ